MRTPAQVQEPGSQWAWLAEDLAKVAGHAAAGPDLNSVMARIDQCLASGAGTADSLLRAENTVRQCTGKLWDLASCLSTSGAIISTPLVVQLRTPPTHPFPSDLTPQLLYHRALVLLVKLDEARLSLQQPSPGYEHPLQRLAACLTVARAWWHAGDLGMTQECLVLAEPYLELALGGAKNGLAGGGTQPHHASTTSIDAEEAMAAVMESLVLRAVVCWRSAQPARALLAANQCSDLLCVPPAEGPLRHTCVVLCVEAASMLLQMVEEPASNLIPPPAGGSGVRDGRDVTGVDMEADMCDGKSRADDAAAALEVAYKLATHAQTTIEESGTQLPATSPCTAAAQLRSRILVWLAYHHLAGGQPAQALPCLSVLETCMTSGNDTTRTSEVEAQCDECDNQARQGPGTYMVPLLRLHALAQSGKLQDAEVEFMTLVACNEAPVATCMAAMRALLRPGESSNAHASGDTSVPAARLLPALQQLQGRVSGMQLCSITLQYLLLAVEQVTAAGGSSAVTSSKTAGTPATSTAASQLDRLLRTLLVPSADQPGAQRLLDTLQQLLVGKDTTAAGSQQGGSQRAGQQQALAVQGMCHRLLWSRGVTHFQARTFTQATELMQASKLYADEVQRMEACKVLALMCLATKQLDKALTNLQEAEEVLVAPDSETTPPLPVFLPFLTLKVCLERGDAQGAATQLQRLTQCEDYTPALMEVVCQEAGRASAWSVACDALTTLHSHVVSGEADHVVEADVLRCHLVCLEKHLLGANTSTFTTPQRTSGAAVAHTSGGAHGRGSGKAVRSGRASGGIQAGAGMAAPSGVTLQDQAKAGGVQAGLATYGALAQLMNKVGKRLDAVGVTQFFGAAGGDKAVLAGLEWFACTGMRLGELAGTDGCAEPSAVLYVAVSSILAHHPAPTYATYRMRRTAATLAMLCATAVARENPSKRDASIQFARRMLTLSREIARQCSDSGSVAPTGQTTDLEWEATMTFYELLLSVLSRDTEAQHQTLELKLPSLPRAAHPSVSQLLEVASLTRVDVFVTSAGFQQQSDTRVPCTIVWLCTPLECYCTDGEYQNLGTAQLCYQRALEALAGEQPVNTQLLLQVARARMELCSDDSKVLAAYQEVAALMQQVAAGGGRGGGPESAQGVAKEDKTDVFPGAEVQWLVATAWNRGAHCARFSRPQDTKGFMVAALDMLPYASREYVTAHEDMMKKQMDAVCGMH